MASSLLMIAVLVFSIRGFFLGFVGVVGKAIGLVLGYVIALSYRAEAAYWVLNNTTWNVPSMVVEIGCGAALFFVTLFTASFAVSACAGVLKKMIPPLQPILDKESTAARITGAVANGALATALVLVGIWIYGLVSKNSVEPPYLQHIANTFGSRLFSAVEQRGDFSLPEFKVPDSASGFFDSASANPTLSGQTSTGSAVIVSESNPNKRLAIETTYREMLKNQDSGQSRQLLKLLDNEQVKALLNNPQLQRFALEQIKNDSQQIEELSETTGFSQDQLLQLLEKLPTQQ